MILKTRQKKHLKITFNWNLFKGNFQALKKVRFPTQEKGCLTGRDFCAQWYQPDCIAH